MWNLKVLCAIIHVTKLTSSERVYYWCKLCIQINKSHNQKIRRKFGVTRPPLLSILLLFFFPLFLFCFLYSVFIRLSKLLCTPSPVISCIFSALREQVRCSSQSHELRNYMEQSTISGGDSQRLLSSVMMRYSLHICSLHTTY
jgi:hypothetical protein